MLAGVRVGWKPKGKDRRQEKTNNKKYMKRSMLLLCGVGVVFALAMGMSDCLAQGRGGAPRDRGDFDPGQFRTRMMERYQEVLGINDTEWKAVEPLIQAVMEKRAATRMGGFGRRGFTGPRRGGEDNAGNRPRSTGFGGEASAEVEALQSALESSSTTPAEIQAKLQALREARKKAAEELDAAQKKLRSVLSVRQEAQMVLMGMLD